MRSRSERLEQAHLYLVCDEPNDDFLACALAGGVDIVQLRMKRASSDQILAAAERVAAGCAAHGALFILNDRPDLVRPAGADGVHIGQHDGTPDEARQLIGVDRIVGLSTHTAGQIDAAAGQPVDYIGVGPVHETPTKPGRPAVGLELVAYAAAHAQLPFFAIGGIGPANVAAVARAGTKRIAVVRALTDATDPRGVARTLRAALTDETISSREAVGGYGEAVGGHA